MPLTNYKDTQYFHVFKETVSHDIFCFRFFSLIIFAQTSENNNRIISSFFENSLRYSLCTTGINNTGGKFVTGVNDTAVNFPTSTAGVIITKYVNFSEK